MDALIEKVYRLTAEQFRQRYGLTADRQGWPPGPASCDVWKGTFGVSETLLREGAQPHSVVLGGPCLVFTHGQARNVTVKDCIDLIAPIRAAKCLNLPCVLLIEIEQLSILAGDGKSPLDDEHWSVMVGVLHNFVRYYALSIGFPLERLHFTCTSEPEVEAVVDDLADRYGALIGTEDICGLYAPDGSSSFPREHPLYERYVTAFKRSLMLYLPAFSEHVTGLAGPSVISAENVNQARAVAVAGKLAGRLNMKAPAMIAHAECPNIAGTRMDHGEEKDKLYVSEPLPVLLGKLGLCDGLVVSYLSKWYTEREPATPADAYAQASGFLTAVNGMFARAYKQHTYQDVKEVWLS